MIMQNIPSDGNRLPLGSALKVRRLDTPNRPVAIARFVGNTLKEAVLHPTVTSYIDKRTGRLVGRDDKKVSEDGNPR